MKIVIIGGVAAGMSSAAKAKRVNKDVEIVVYEKGDFVSYGACGLPYFLASEDDHNILIARTKEEFEKQGIKVFLNHEVVKISPDKKEVFVKNLKSGETFSDSYDKLFIATGAKPVFPPFKGRNLKGVHLLKTLDDGIKLKETLANEDIKDVVIVGGGYIGIEVGEVLHQLGKNVRVIEMADRILTTFDREITEIAEKELISKGIKLNLQEKVEEIVGEERVEGVKTDKGLYKGDLVIIAIGVKPATEFLKDSGIDLAPNGAIIVDREMKTNIEDIYAAGDCAQIYHRVLEQNTYIPLATTANKCGRIVAENLVGANKKFVGTLGSAAIKVLDLELGRTGLSEADAVREGLDYKTVFVKTHNHPSYYPNQKPIWFKLIVEGKSNKILGVQGIGYEGVVLRINTFAVAIHQGMTTEELGMVDLCYAPPFSGVWDAVHIACNAVK